MTHLALSLGPLHCPLWFLALNKGLVVILSIGNLGPGHKTLCVSLCAQQEYLLC